MPNRRDTEASDGREGTEQDEELEQELITRPSTTALNLTGASIRDSSYPGEPGAALLAAAAAAARAYAYFWAAACLQEAHIW